MFELTPRLKSFSPNLTLLGGGENSSDTNLGRGELNIEAEAEEVVLALLLVPRCGNFSKNIAPVFVSLELGSLHGIGAQQQVCYFFN